MKTGTLAKDFLRGVRDASPSVYSIPTTIENIWKGFQDTITFEKELISPYAPALYYFVNKPMRERVPREDPGSRLGYALGVATGLTILPAASYIAIRSGVPWQYLAGASAASNVLTTFRKR